MHDSGDVDADLAGFLEALAAATASPQGRALLTVVASAREDPELRAVVDEVFERRLSALDRRLQVAIERGELPPVESSFVAELLAGSVQLSVTRGARAFTRADAVRVTGVVLAGIRATHST
ncbi:TetR-like C-terminal domain-containing protein [Amycolatopsis sp. cmx-4-83]|uniref:TetR-like C-terminal domain-containing protein n=1 Tax=Amycolatopsis sp. cmx-4-83 TaxID=2790940 RepID=UPI003978511D